MNGFRTLPGVASRSAVLGRCALVGSMFVAAAAGADEHVNSVQFVNGDVAVPAEGQWGTPTFECPPGWLAEPMPPQMLPVPGGMPAPPGRPAPYTMPQQPAPWSGPYAPQMQPGQRSGQAPSSGSALPQADPRSPVRAPFTAGAVPSQGAQASATPAGFNPANALAAATAPASVAPNMIGDFFGAISSEPIILPGAIVRQAILIQPMQVPLGPVLLDHYRSVVEIDPVGNPGMFNTGNFVYLSMRNGQFVDVMPSRVPPQLLTEFDDAGVFVGDPADLGMVTNPGPLIALDSGTVGNVDTQPPLAPQTLLGVPIFNIHDALLIFAPTPGSGGGVGRQKIAENTSPIPRDRIFLNHSTFTGVPLTQDGINVYRFSPGIEKAFYEQRYSIEVRFPFASTLDSDISANGGTDINSTEFGNIVTTLKALVQKTGNSAVAIGVSMTVPTANDLSVNDLRGSSFLSIENESVHVMPFIGGTHNRGKWFSQWYLQGDLDTTGSPVEIRNVMTGELEDAGTLNDAAFLYASLSGGYWIYQNGHRATSFESSPGRSIKRTVYAGGTGITGLAPLVEFHFNRSLDKSEVIGSGPIQFRSASDFSLTNFVLGAVMTFGTGGSITAAWGTPIIGQDDKQYEHEARVMLDYEY